MADNTSETGLNPEPTTFSGVGDIKLTWDEGFKDLLQKYWWAPALTAGLGAVSLGSGAASYEKPGEKLDPKKRRTRILRSALLGGTLGGAAGGLGLAGLSGFRKIPTGSDPALGSTSEKVTDAVAGGLAWGLSYPGVFGSLIGGFSGDAAGAKFLGGTPKKVNQVSKEALSEIRRIINKMTGNNMPEISRDAKSVVARIDNASINNYTLSAYLEKLKTLKSNFAGTGSNQAGFGDARATSLIGLDPGDLKILEKQIALHGRMNSEGNKFYKNYHTGNLRRGVSRVGGGVSGAVLGAGLQNLLSALIGASTGVVK